MSIAQEQHWANELQKTRQQQLQTNSTPLAVQLQHIAEELLFQKTRLHLALQTKNQSDIELRLNRLIELRAKATVLTLLTTEKQTPLTPEIIEKEVKMYYTECSNLMAHVAMNE